MVAVYGYNGKICCHEPPYTEEEDMEAYRLMVGTGPITVLRGPRPAVAAPDAEAPQPPPGAPSKPAAK